MCLYVCAQLAAGTNPELGDLILGKVSFPCKLGSKLLKLQAAGSGDLAMN